MIKNNIILLSVLISLSGCGGGGGGDDSPTKPSPSISLDQKAILVPETTTKTLSFSTSFDDIALKVVSEKPNGVALLSLKGGQVEIVSNETDRPAFIEAVIYSEGKGVNHSSSETISVVIENTSAKELESKVKNLIDQKESVINLKDDKSVFNFISDFYYLNEKITFSERNSYIAQFLPENSPNFYSLSNQIDNLQISYELYKSSDLSDVNLNNDFMASYQELKNHGDYAKNQFSNIQSIEPYTHGDLSVTEFEYDPVSKTYSRFIGHNETGSYINEIWTFDQDYQFIDSLITK